MCPSWNPSPGFCFLGFSFASTDLLWLKLKQLILLVLLAGWSWFLGVRPWWESGRSTLVDEDGAVAEQVAQSPLELERELLELGEGGEEWSGEDLGEESANNCC